MIKTARDKFNSSFSNDKYKTLLKEIEAKFPDEIDFRVAESPIFIDKDLKIKLLQAGNDIINSILDPSFKEKTNRAIPEKHWVKGETERFDALAIDFAICKNLENEFEPKLIELQAFPSLFAYQAYLSSKYKKHFAIDNTLSPYFNRLNAASYISEMKDYLLDGNKSEEVILLELYPEKQKTRLDFALSKAYWNINTICVTKVYQKAKKLYYKNEAEIEVEIKRIYNRLIFDDLEENLGDIKLNFDFKSDLDVSWFSHPNWFYRVSKFCLPFLKSPFVPSSYFLNEIDINTIELEKYVLKPLFSFAGKGVIIDLKSEDLESIKDKENYILQEKVAYEPCLEDLSGNKIKAEIRLLYVWPKKSKYPKLMTNLARLSRGKMIGVAYNKDFDWVGGSSAFFETN